MIPTKDDAFRVGRTGAKVDSYDRMLFEEYMKGHCWAVGNWIEDHQQYDDMWSRVAYAIWRDCASIYKG